MKALASSRAEGMLACTEARIFARQAGIGK